MALIVCMECRKDVSDKAKKCPHCGAPIAAGTSVLRAASPGPATRTFASRAARYVLVVTALGAAYLVWQATTSDKKAPFSAGVTAAFREPRKIADERVGMKAGQNVSYAFGLETDSRVHVSVVSAGCPVDVRLMPKADAERFCRAGGGLSGGQYACRPDLSLNQVGLMDKTEVVTKGEWALVVARPKDGPAGIDNAPVGIALTVY